MKRAIRTLCLTALLAGAAGRSAGAEAYDGRTSGEPPAASPAEMRTIGGAVCGAGGYELFENGVKCLTCPEFTGEAGAGSGLELGYPLRGRFTGSGEEWILDSRGCEPHFANYGGAVLLRVSGSGAAPASGTLSMVYYRPGFRLNDCLVFGRKRSRDLLVCNEEETAQGEVIGHISVIEPSRRGITRWRLLRWYDNSAAVPADITTVVPTEMRQVWTEDGEQRLHIGMKIAGGSGQPAEKTATLVYQRKGQRLFAAAESRPLLEQINRLIGSNLD